MTPEQKSRIIAASTSAMVLLLFILIAVMVYQMISINGRRTKIEKLEAQIAELEEEQARLTNDIDLWISEWKIEERARELKYVYPDDKSEK